MRDRSLAAGHKFWRSETRRAREEHECIEECEDPIFPGALYRHVVEKDPEGRFWHAKVCSQCDQDWSELLLIEAKADPNNVLERTYYGELDERVLHAFERGWINRSNPLAQRWVPEELLEDPSYEPDEILVGRENPLQMPLPI